MSDTGSFPFMWVLAGLMLAALTTVVAVRTRKQ
ncbi:LPXTG cell wall anchor domain-containing protein [Planococcus kocurii]